jgi:hypothetical protein
METKEFSKKDVSVAKNDETFNDGQLEALIGGQSAEAKPPCGCDCWIGNSNTTTPPNKLNDVE